MGITFWSLTGIVEGQWAQLDFVMEGCVKGVPVRFCVALTPLERECGVVPVVLALTIRL